MNLKKQKPILIIVLLFLVFGSGSARTTVDKLRSDIGEKQTQLDQITAEIQNLQKEIISKQKQAASLKNEVALFDLQIRQTEAQIQAVELEIEKFASQIQETQITIQDKEDQIKREKEFLAETLRLINEYDTVSALEIALSNDTFSQFLDQVQYATNLSEKNQEILNTLKTLKRQLEEKKAELTDQLLKQEQLKAELNSARNSLEDQRNTKQTLLARTRGQEKIYRTLLAETAKKQEEVEREIFELEVVVRQQLGEKTLPPIVGLLRWPMSGILTQGYGKTGFTALGYNFHNGIDIAAPAGTKIYSAGNGLVFATGTGKAAYGNWVVIKHTLSKDGEVYNIYTLYGHLQSFIVSVGQAVRGGDLIGFEGNVGNTTRLLYGPERGYHLHFSIFDEEDFDIKPGAYQDIYGPYQIPYGYSYNPLEFLR